MAGLMTISSWEVSTCRIQRVYMKADLLSSIPAGGTAGCVLASRLFEEPDITVLVLEKGHVKDNVVSRMPLLSHNMFPGNPLQVQSTRWSEPIQEANGRRTTIWTAEGLGGATRMNAMLFTRGFRADHVAWSKELGLFDWGWEQVEPYFRKIKNSVEHPESESRGNDDKIYERSNTRASCFLGSQYHFVDRANRGTSRQDALRMGPLVSQPLPRPTISDDYFTSS